MFSRLLLAAALLGGITLPAIAQVTFPNAAGRTVVQQGKADELSVSPGTGTVPRPLKDLLSNEVHAANYGAVPDDGVDDGPALREAIKIAQQRRARLRLPGGVLNVCTDPNDAEALLRITSVMELAGASRGTTIMPCATAGDRAVVLMKPAASAGGIRGAVLRDFTIGVLGPTPRYGGDGIKIDTTNKHGFIAKLLVENVSVADAGAGKYAVHHVNVSTMDNSTNPPTQLTGNVTGGLFASTFRDSDFFGGMKFEQTGDSNNVERCIITGPNEGIFYGAISGAATARFVGNNITATGDTIVVDGGQQIKILENQLEAVGTYTGSRSVQAIVTVNAAVDVVIRNNNMNGYTRADIVYASGGSRGVRVEPNTATYAADHFLYRAVASPGNIVERQTAETAGTAGSVVGKSLVSLDAASWTLGVWQQMTLLNGWTAGTDANYRNGLWWMPLPDGTVRLAGIVAYNATNPTLPIANFPAAFRVSGKAQRLMAIGNNNGVYGPYMISLDFAGNISGEGVKPNAFYQFDNATFSTRPQ